MASLEEVVEAEPAKSDVAPTCEVEHPSSHARLYRLLWRWHFYAGVITAPIFLIAAVTGALYVFIDELKPWMYPDLMVAASSSTAELRTLDELTAAVKQEFPQAKIQSIAESAAPGLNSEVSVRMSEGNRAVFVDPTTGRVAGTFDERESFFGIVLNLHRRLFLGAFGRLLVELTASWGLVLLITGCYLWWPRGKGKAAAQGYGVWRPRLRGSLRTVLRDWHAVVGIYALPTAVFVLATGLFFTQLFSPTFNWVSKQVSAASPAPPKSAPAAGRQPITLNAVVLAAEPHLPGSGPVRVTLPNGPDDTIRVARRDTSLPTWKSTVYVDAYSGEIAAVQGWNTSAPLQKVRLSVYPIHVGSIFGLTTKVLALSTCLALILLTITGVWMWWRSRPRGTWGLPPADAATRAPTWLTAIIVLLAVMLPALGLSLILILLGEWIWLRFANRRLTAT